MARYAGQDVYVEFGEAALSGARAVSGPSDGVWREVTAIPDDEQFNISIDPADLQAAILAGDVTVTDMGNGDDDTISVAVKSEWLARMRNKQAAK